MEASIALQKISYLALTCNLANDSNSYNNVLINAGAMTALQTTDQAIAEEQPELEALVSAAISKLESNKTEKHQMKFLVWFMMIVIILSPFDCVHTSLLSPFYVPLEASGTPRGRPGRNPGCRPNKEQMASRAVPWVLGLRPMGPDGGLDLLTDGGGG
ncbi:hypothetical protein V6N13_069507 [Hibiscus sabdariffa]